MRQLLAIIIFLSSTVFAENITIVNTPPPIDLEMVDRIWDYIKRETKAPNDLPVPVVVMDWEVPILAKMGYQFPTIDYPDNISQISIAPRTVDMWPRDMISWGIGHEMTHYAFIMKENNWETNRRFFINNMKHHCNEEFIRITKGIADLIYSTYHSNVDRYKMYDEVALSCRLHPEQ